MSNKKIICTDVDGIVVKWQSGLPYFAQKYNLPVERILEMMTTEKFIKPEDLFECEKSLAIKLLLKYNNSDFIRYLAPYADALCVINKLKSEYDFVAITALGNSVDANLNRRFNLNALFPGAFTEIMVCDYNESKDELLNKAKSKYGNKISCYVDDLPKHVEAAGKVFDGTNTRVFYMPRGEREKCEFDSVVVKDWHQISTCLKSIQSIEPNTPSMDDIFKKMNEDLPYINPSIKPIHPIQPIKNPWDNPTPIPGTFPWTSPNIPPWWVDKPSPPWWWVDKPSIISC